MKEGWFWQDTSDSSLEDRVTLAAQKYREKYGRAPTVCYVNSGQHAEALGDDGFDVGGVAVRGMRNIARNYFWLGMEKIKKGGFS